MNDEKKSIRVEISGNEYFIKADEKTDPDYIKIVANHVDEKMREISQASSIISSTKIAILAALNITDELFRLKKDRKIPIPKLEKTKKNTKAEKLIKMFEEVGL